MFVDHHVENLAAQIRVRRAQRGDVIRGMRDVASDLRVRLRLTEQPTLSLSQTALRIEARGEPSALRAFTRALSLMDQLAVILDSPHGAALH